MLAKNLTPEQRAVCTRVMAGEAAPSGAAPAAAPTRQVAAQDPAGKGPSRSGS